jgi:ParB family chromosome partitioning protein
VDGRITEGHARALGGLPLDAQPRALATILEAEMSVRQVEELVRRVREPRVAVADPAAEPATAADPEVERVEEDLRRALGTKVRLARTRRGGRIVIEYYGDDELARIYQRLVGGAS